MPGIEHGKVCVFGPGGSVGAISYPVLKQRYTLRLIDRDPIDAVVARRANQSIHRGTPRRSRRTSGCKRILPIMSKWNAP